MTIKPALYCDHGQWQVTEDETCLYLPRAFWSRLSGRREPRLSYQRCRLWALLHSYGWLPVA